MGNIPIPRHQHGPPFRAAAAKGSWPEYQTRDRRAMAGFGASLASLGEKFMNQFLEARVNSEFTEGRALWVQRHDEFTRSLKDEQDYKSIPKNYEKFSAELQKEVLGLASTKGASTGLRNWLIEEAPKQNKKVSLIAVEKEQDYMRASTLNAVDVHIRDGNAPAAIAALIRARKAGYFSAEEVERRSQTVAREADWNAGIEALEVDPISFLEDINDKGYLESLDAELRSRLKSQAKAVIRNTEIEQKRIEREVWDKTEGEAFNLLFDHQLTPEWIRDQFNQGNMSPQDRDEYLRATVKPDDEVEVNYEAYDRLQGLVEDYDAGKVDKEKVRQAITDAVGKDITTTIARSLRDRLATKDKPDDPMNRSDVKRGLGFLEDLETAEVNAANKRDANYEEVRGIRQKYRNKMDEFEQWIRGQEKLTDKDIQNKTDEMTQEEAKEITLSWIGRVMRPKEATPFFGRFFGTTEEEALAKKKIKELQELGKWEGLTPNEQETIRQAFLAGKSIQDVLDIMGQ